MKESGATGEGAFPESAKDKPVNWTGRELELKSSNQSSPVVGVAIHSLTRKAVGEPSGWAMFAVPGVGVVRTNASEPAGIAPMEKSTACGPKRTESIRVLFGE